MNRLILLSRILKDSIFDPDDFSFENLQYMEEIDGNDNPNNIDGDTLL